MGSSDENPLALELARQIQDGNRRLGKEMGRRITGAAPPIESTHHNKLIIALAHAVAKGMLTIPLPMIESEDREM